MWLVCSFISNIKNVFPAHLHVETKCESNNNETQSNYIEFMFPQFLKVKNQLNFQRHVKLIKNTNSLERNSFQKLQR